MPKAFRDLSLKFFQTSQEDGVAVLKLNRPPANAHHLAMIEELGQAVLAIRFDASVKAIVMGSASDRFFSAGADIQAIRDESAEQLGLLSQTSKEVIMQMRATPKVYLAAVNGHCMGGGLELALACDLRFAADASYQIGVPEVALGLIPGEGGTQLLGRILGTSRALDLMITGRPLTPREAKDLGLLSQTSKEVIMQMRATPKIYLAAVDGHCMGGGLELALACDVRFAADAKYQIGVPEVALGLIPGEGGTQLLGRVLGTSRALDLMITGRTLSPREAKDIGLLDFLVPPDTLQAEVLDYARKIAKGPSRAIGFTKIALTEGVGMPLWSAFAWERELQNQLFEHPDCKEGVRAFFEKREPKFGGA